MIASQSIVRPHRVGVVLTTLLLVFAFLAAAAPPAEATPFDNNCRQGSYTGRGFNSLSNGTLVGKFCDFSANRNAAQAEIAYVKSGGAPVTVAVGWEFTNSKGSTTFGRVLKGKKRITAGQDVTVRYDYSSPGRVSPSLNSRCFRGSMAVYNSAGTVIDRFTTRVVCP